MTQSVSFKYRAEIEKKDVTIITHVIVSIRIQRSGSFGRSLRCLAPRTRSVCAHNAAEGKRLFQSLF